MTLAGLVSHLRWVEHCWFEVLFLNCPAASNPQMDACGRNPDYGAEGLSLRWMLLHMVEEVARHVGHMDVLREQLDGAKGYY